MNDVLMEELLNQPENSQLDFKIAQYPFDKANEIQKGELLKDILAFANVIKDSSAYILIGVDEVKGGRSNVVGVSNHLDDARLQQFVNSKTRRPVIFSYETFQFEGKQIGIIEILPQVKLPIFITSDYGKVRKNIVYCRNGSSTTEIAPDEIAEMILPTLIRKIEIPNLALQFVDAKNKDLLGNSIIMTSKVLKYEVSKIVKKPRPSSIMMIGFGNEHFEIQMANYLRETSMVKPFYFQLTNISSTLATDVRLEIKMKRERNISVLGKADYPRKPDRQTSISFRGILNISNTNVEKGKNYLNLSAKFGNIQPKASNKSDNFFIGASKPCKLEVEAIVYANNLPEPLVFPLSINIKTETEKLDVEKLKDMD